MKGMDRLGLPEPMGEFLRSDLPAVLPAVDPGGPAGAGTLRHPGAPAAGLPGSPQPCFAPRKRGYGIIDGCTEPWTS